MSETTSGTIPVGVYEKAASDLARWKARAREAESKVDTITKDRDGLAGRLAELESSAKELQAKLDQQPGDLQKTIEKLQAEIRTRTHRDDFNKHAKSYKGEKGETIREDALDALWRLSGYTPDGDTPNGDKITEAIKAAVAAQPFVLQPPGQPAEAAAVAAYGVAPTPRFAAAPAGPGVVRGATEPSKTATVADAVQARFEAAKGAGASPYRIA